MKPRDKKSKPSAIEDEDDKALFRDAMNGVAPLPASNKIIHKHPQPPAIPRQTKYQAQDVVEDSLSDHIALEIEAGDGWSYLRPGLARLTLRRLRRGYWKTQAYLDLHGFTRDEARQELVVFLDECARKKYRCMRIIHGKGLSSKNREPVLKIRIGNWLVQRDDVLAFCQARPEDGGGGAVVVLLKS
jgi:DNA-nicking Smr family endonuclease